MTPDVVVDIGNTRMKWGLCRGDRVAEVLRLPLDDAAVWDAELAKLPPPQSFARKWAAASVNPPALHRFVAWAHDRGGTAVFERYTDLPIRLNVDEPEKVGLDRLVGAVAARAMTPAGVPAITVDVGTAVTVNLIDADGVFQGGAIFPGPRLMARALHEFTAKLPLSEPTNNYADFRAPAKNTAAALRTGILAALSGGVVELTAVLAERCATPPWLFVTGGGAHLLDVLNWSWIAGTTAVEALTLEGIRIAAEARP
ncbi:MAG: type III pantothenate kinase [Planctomycetes bacterium]|nr:type III pantothenate kinase [Planctomycetota bacterium]